MANEEGTDPPVAPDFKRPPFPFDRSDHVVLGLDDEGTWHVAASSSLEMMRTHCFRQTVGTVQMAAPWSQLVVAWAGLDFPEEPVSLPPGVDPARICERCKAHVIAFHARKLACLLRLLGLPAGIRPDVVHAANALAAVGVG